jgi:hypothetical protein
MRHLTLEEELLHFACIFPLIMSADKYLDGEVLHLVSIQTPFYVKNLTVNARNLGTYTGSRSALWPCDCRCIKSG